MSLYAQVVIDVPTRAFDSAFTYMVPSALQGQIEVGCCVLVDFSNRPVLAYVMSLDDKLDDTIDSTKVKPIRELLSTSLFDEAAAELAYWMAREYIAPLSETVSLFTPPGSSIKLKKDADGSWHLKRAGAAPVDDRWVGLTEQGADYVPKANAAKQHAILAALRACEMRVQDLALEISNPASAIKALESKGVIYIESRRRMRGSTCSTTRDEAQTKLTTGQQNALNAVLKALNGEGDTLPPCHPQVILIDGVTGSGKTEVYLQAISSILDDDTSPQKSGSAIALVPEISLTPQTVARFRARFGEQVAILHSRLSAGERFDQWELARSGKARVVVGARSALFAPVKDLRLIIIDEEHDSSYKQGSSPRYVTRDVAAKLAQLRGAVLVLGSATPSMEALRAVELGKYKRVELPDRVSGQQLPPIQIVDLSVQFRSGNKSMFSLPLREALIETIDRKEKAVLLLNKRGFASFLLCRDCGYVPTCESCATSFTYHTQPARLICHHCGAEQTPPAVCPDCGSVAIKQLGPGTQFAAQQLQALLPEGTPVIRMDADSTRGKDGHEQCLNEFIAAPYGVLLGTQMIAKGLDFPDVTLVGVLIADTALKFPDFRAPELTYQLLEQVSGRAGRAEKDGRVIVQTYWPEHTAIRAAAAHNRELLLNEERETRSEIGYPPYSRLANIIIWGKDLKAVSAESLQLAQVIEDSLGDMAENVQVLGPCPCVLAKRQGNHRWHILIKTPEAADLPALLAPAIRSRKTTLGVNIAVDVDPYNLL